MTEDCPRAVLDVGSNTVRLLVARVHDGQVEPVADRSEFVRLGLGVDKTGRLDEDRVTAALQAIRSLVNDARELGAESVPAIATSAVRDAENRDEFVRRVRDEAGVELAIISGEREAELTFRGASAGLDLSGGVIICDLGGGSAELICADRSGVQWARSEKLGSGRLSERFMSSDPPSSADVERLTTHVREILAGLPPARADRVIFTGGTASHVALLAGQDTEPVKLAPAELSRIARLVATVPSDEIIRRYNVRPERARVLAAGINALDTIARFYGAKEVVITRHGLREGALVSPLR